MPASRRSRWIGPTGSTRLTFEIYAELRDLFAALAHRDEVKVVIITGEGRGFCSGGDVEGIIGELLKQDMTQLLAFTRMTGALIRNIRAVPKPVIAAINGIAAGAGAVIALASDFRIAVPSARLAFLFTRVGLAGADMGAAYLLPRVVGLARATELLMLGDNVSSQRALEIGLINAISRAGKPHDRCQGAGDATRGRTCVRPRHDQDPAQPGAGSRFRLGDRGRGTGAGDLHADAVVSRGL